jgi:ribosomal-protein-alanine N-acetyltransferase
MMKYCLMTSEHVAQVAALECECFSMPWSEKSIRGELTNPLSLWVIATDGETVAGYVGSQSVMGEADMMNIAVLPAYRRQGIAKELVSELIRLLKEREVYSLTLEVRASNEPAIALYNLLGFEQVGRRPNYYSAPKEDALILRKEWYK